MICLTLPGPETKDVSSSSRETKDKSSSSSLPRLKFPASNCSCWPASFACMSLLPEIVRLAGGGCGFGTALGLVPGGARRATKDAFVVGFRTCGWSVDSSSVHSKRAMACRFGAGRLAASGLRLLRFAARAPTGIRQTLAWLGVGTPAFGMRTKPKGRPDGFIIRITPSLAAPGVGALRLGMITRSLAAPNLIPSSGRALNIYATNGPTNQINCKQQEYTCGCSSLKGCGKHARMQTSANMYVRTYAHLYIHTYVSIYMYNYTYIRIRMYIYTYTYTYIYIYTYIHTIYNIQYLIYNDAWVVKLEKFLIDTRTLTTLTLRDVFYSNRPAKGRGLQEGPTLGFTNIQIQIQIHTRKGFDHHSTQLWKEVR